MKRLLGFLSLLFLGAAPGWGLYFAAHLFIGGTGARRLARKLGASAEASLAAGIAFAQTVKPQARTLAADRGITWAEVDYELLRGADSDVLRLF